MSDSKGVDRRALLKGSAATAMIMALLRGESAAAASAAGAPGGVAAAGRRRGALNSTGSHVFTANQTVTTLIPDRLYRIGCVVRAEMLSWLPEDLDAYEPLNAYMLMDDENCIFQELGMPVTLPAMQSALELVGKRKVYVWFSRNELDCIGNMGYVFGSCESPTLLFGAMAGGILEWINDPAVAITEVRDFLGRIPIESVRNGVKRKVGAFDFSYMDAGSKQMIMTQWAFDATTGTMFTSESFGFRHLKHVNDSPVITSAKGLPSVSTVAREIVERFNWMREAEFPHLIARFEQLFKDHDVQILAPVHGCVIQGREAVRAHVKLMTDAMRAASKLSDSQRLQYV